MTGRPRDPELERRLLAATWSVLTSQGYDSLTVSQVAAGAGAHRSDIYRRWPTKAQLVTAALAEHLAPIGAVDTGALLSDLRAFLDDLAATWFAPWIDGLVALLADLHRDPDAESAFREMARDRARPVVDALARAAERGEITGVPDAQLVGHLLEGPLMHRSLFLHRPARPEDLDAIARSVHRLLTERPDPR